MSSADELIVIDSASSNYEPVREIAGSFGARCLRCMEPGAARARNLGIRSANGEFIAFTDDDATVSKTWLDAFANTLQTPNIQAVVGPVFDAKHDESVLLMPFSEFDPSREQTTFERKGRDWFSRLRYGAIGYGANLAVRRSAFEIFGYFREGLGAGAPIGGDENYFLLSVIESGGVVANNPNAQVWHPPLAQERLRQIRDYRLAYLLYLFWTRPKIRLHLLKSVLRRDRRARKVASDTHSSFLREMLTAPGLLARALKMDNFSTEARSSAETQSSETHVSS